MLCGLWLTFSVYKGFFAVSFRGIPWKLRAEGFSASFLKTQIKRGEDPLMGVPIKST